MLEKALVFCHRDDDPNEKKSLHRKDEGKIDKRNRIISISTFEMIQEIMSDVVRAVPSPIPKNLVIPPRTLSFKQESRNIQKKDKINDGVNCKSIVSWLSGELLSLMKRLAAY